MDNTNNEIKTLLYNNQKIRTIQKDGQIHWVVKDACDTFGAKHRTRLMQNLDEDEKGYTQMVTPLGLQEMATVNESRLYSLLFAMRPVKARGVSKEYIENRQQKLKLFKRWITHEVLPSIRKFGVYITPEKLSELENNPDALPQLIRKIRKDQVIIETLQEQVKEYTDKVTLANAFLTEGETITIGEFAKILNSNGVNIGQNRLFQMLRDNKFIMKTDSQFNEPTQKASDMKLLRVVRRTVINESGRASFSKTTQVTAKGQLYFTNFFLKKTENEKSKRSNI
jgi:anti-repressor protein